VSLIHEHLLKYLFVDEYYMAHVDKDKIYGARLHVFIEREHNNDCTHHGSNLEACTSGVNQDQAFETRFSNGG
jgi:hypothetical protein